MACRKVFSNCKYLKLNHFKNVVAYSTTRKDLSDVTHTGQVWDEKDYRNVRFTNSLRVVNKNHAINLINEVPVTETDKRVIACDGGGGPLGHPKVYINLDKPGTHACNYCGLQFKKKEHH